MPPGRGLRVIIPGGVLPGVAFLCQWACMRGAFLIILKVLAGVAAYVLLVAAWYAVVPDVKGLATKNPAKTSFMEYREKEWAEQGRKMALRWKWVPLSAMSPTLIKAVLVSEDDKFWAHEGFDFEAMRDALEKNLEQGRVRAGGSTVSQQLAKNLWLSPSKNPMRKVKEAVLAWRLERDLSKRRILEIYLNVVEWGDGIFGAEAAAQAHFGVSARNLTAEQAVRLAVSLPNPVRFDPAGSSGFVRKRTAIVLSRLRRRGVFEPVSEHQKAMEVPVPESPAAMAPARPDAADETVAQALDWVKKEVEESEKAGEEQP